MARFAVLRIVALALAVLSATVGPARASVITTGDVDPGGAATYPDPWAVGGDLKVGDSGNGALTIQSGGVVTNTAGYIGYSSGSTGEVTVTGADSQWNNSNWLFVGQWGDGTLNIESAGVVASYDGHIGFNSTATGIATVTRSGSQWNNSNSLTCSHE